MRDPEEGTPGRRPFTVEGPTHPRNRAHSTREMGTLRCRLGSTGPDWSLGPVGRSPPKVRSKDLELVP